MSTLHCCCGSRDCAFLAHNSTLLEGVERNVAEAAQRGQALLIRHEHYVANSERERHRMTSTIEALEKEREELEQKNARTIRENRDLTDKLEQLNREYAASDSKVQSLTEKLQVTQGEIDRLAIFEARVELLEGDLKYLEQEQAALLGMYKTKDEDERTAVQRWRRAEKMIGDLQDQIDRIEAEARAEQGRHEEIVARMERRMAVSGGLVTVGGRSQTQKGREKTASTVSHFVEDIFLRNTNLQNGIVELRDLLHSSYEEVENLREQLQRHQPVSRTDEAEPYPINLKNELGTESIVNQELHIHHHYHGPALKKEGAKANPQRRTRKKRIGLTPGNFAPLVPQDASCTGAILSHTSVTVPPPNMQRWSNATTLAPSSLPGSPLSMSHRGSMYDRVFSDSPYDSSRPTSPSDSITSPVFAPHQARDSLARHQKRKSLSLKPPSLSTIRSSSSPISPITKQSPATAVISAASPSDSVRSDIFVLSPQLNSVIHEEEGELANPATPNQEDEFDLDEVVSPSIPRPSILRRAASHESLISVSGMDIHTLQSRPSQLSFSTSPRLAQPSFSQTSQPTLSPWTATATAHMSRHDYDSSTYNKSLLYGSRVDYRRGVHTPRKETFNGSVGKALKVGGWVLGKWGAAPTPSLPRTEPSSSVPKVQVAVSVKSDTSSTPPASIKSSETKTKDVPVRLRPPGVNQPGPIWGFFDVPPTPTKIVVTDLDADALNDALAGA